MLVESYLQPEELRRLCLSVELAYQSRAWSASGRSDSRLQHAVAVAATLAELQMEGAAVCGGLLVGVCEDTGLTLQKIDQVLGPEVAGCARSPLAKPG